MTVTVDDSVLSIANEAFDLHRIVTSMCSHVQLAHQIEGRVRFRVRPSITSHPAASRFVGAEFPTAIGTIRGVRAIKINKLARSCTVEYDPTVIPDAAWPDTLAGKQSTAANVLLDILQEKIEEVRRGQL